MQAEAAEIVAVVRKCHECGRYKALRYFTRRSHVCSKCRWSRPLGRLPVARARSIQIMPAGRAALAELATEAA